MMSDFRECRLHDARLYHARLHDACLHNARLYDARLHDACLNNARLYDACLHDACLHDAHIPQSTSILTILIIRRYSKVLRLIIHYSMLFTCYL